MEDIPERYKILSADSARSRSKITQRKDIMTRIKKQTKVGGYRIQYQFTSEQSEIEKDVNWLRQLGYRVTKLDQKDRCIPFNEYIIDWWPTEVVF